MSNQDSVSALPAYHVLVIDDEPENTQLVQDCLHRHGYQVATANEGHDGLLRAAATRPDLILLDDRMPGMDGYETCRLLRVRPETQGIPVVFVSALGSSDELARSVETNRHTLNRQFQERLGMSV